MSEDRLTVRRPLPDGIPSLTEQDAAESTARESAMIAYFLMDLQGYKGDGFLERLAFGVGHFQGENVVGAAFRAVNQNERNKL